MCIDTVKCTFAKTFSDYNRPVLKLTFSNRGGIVSFLRDEVNELQNFFSHLDIVSPYKIFGTPLH